MAQYKPAMVQHGTTLPQQSWDRKRQTGPSRLLVAQHKDNIAKSISLTWPTVFPKRTPTGGKGDMAYIAEELGIPRNVAQKNQTITFAKKNFLLGLFSIQCVAIFLARFLFGTCPLWGKIVKTSKLPNWHIFPHSCNRILLAQKNLLAATMGWDLLPMHTQENISILITDLERTL